MIKTYKKKTIIYMIIWLLFIVGCIIFANSYSFYGSPVMKVSGQMVVSQRDKSGVNGKTETYYTQELTGTIKNGEYKGQTVTVTNEYSASQLTTEKYHKGDKIFVRLIEKNGSLGGSVLYERRDTYLVVIAGIFFLSLIMVSGKRGFLTFLSLVVNIGVFCACLKFCDNRDFFQWIWIGVTVFFSIVTLLFAGGFHRKTLGAVISTIITTAAVYFIYQLLVAHEDTVPYEMMDYVITPVPLKKIYMISVILGFLGAIMDVAITINSSVSELVRTSSFRSARELFGSVREIGYDIMGTMINVLFFSYLSSSLPSIIVKLHSGYRMSTIIRYSYVFDIVRFLIGAIGLVIAIIVSEAVAVGISGRKVTEK